MALIQEPFEEKWIKTYSDYETDTQIGMVENKDGVRYSEAIDLPEYVEEKEYKEVIVDKPIEDKSEEPTTEEE